MGCYGSVGRKQKGHGYAPDAAQFGLTLKTLTSYSGVGGSKEAEGGVKNGGAAP